MAANIRKNIFISYRVKDTQLATGRLVDALKQHIHENQIFMDIDKIDPGLDFTQVISKYLNSSEVMLAIIGPDWMAYNPDKGTYRINDNNDWVRKEIASALQRNIRVIPVLLDGGSMPDEDQLPDDLKPLLLRQSYEISNKRWKYDCDQLIEVLRRTMGDTEPNLPQNKELQSDKPSGNKSKILWIIAAAVFFLIVIFQLTKNSSADEPQKPLPIYDTAIPKTEPQASQTEPAAPSVSETVSIKSIAGKWYDPNGKGTFYITQDEGNLMIKAYGVSGQQTGMGSGYIKGDNVTMQITITADDLVIPSEFNLRLSAQETELNGSLKIEQNGAAYTEKVHLERQ